MIISLIVAKDVHGGIGKKNNLPWHLRSDLQRFKKITMGHHILMGRKTYETIGRPLPGRIMIIVTRNKQYKAEGCIIVHSVEEAIKLAKARNESELFIIGGGDLYEMSISLADKLYLTHVHADVNADVFFPLIDLSEWKTTLREKFTKSEEEEYASDFEILIRNR